MPEIKFSESQLKAIETGGNVIVSAGAGSGKTAVMIERIVRKLIGGARLDRMLIVTFTRSAAADIRAKLALRLTELKNSQTARAQDRRAAVDALDAMPIANIGTLHSFCQRLIRSYFYAADIELSATLVEDDDATAMKLVAVRAAIDGALAEGGAFTDIYEALSSRRDDSGAVKAVMRILDYALSVPDPEEYLSRKSDDGSKLCELDGLTENRHAALIRRADELTRELAEIDAAILALGEDDVSARMPELIACVSEIPDFIDGKIDDFTPFSLVKKKNEIGEAYVRRGMANDKFKVLKADCKLFRSALAEVEQAKQRDSAPYADALKKVALIAHKAYSERKTKFGRIDYSDLEHGARRVLADSECKKEIQNNIRYVFIDEFQDVNPLQASIAEMLAECNAEMFLIGDIKQSIYGFRRCSPKFFKRAIDAARAHETDYTHVPLNDNYRSSREVIEFVNKVFDGVMTERFGGAEYSEQPLAYGNKKITGGSASFYTIESCDDDGDGDDGAPDGIYSVMNAADEDVSDTETQFIVDEILEYIDGDKASSLGSVAVLVRALDTEFCSRLAQAFDKSGIKYNFGKSLAYAEYPEAVTLLAMLNCIDNRYDDVALYTSLRHGMGGFSDVELAEIAEVGERLAREKGVKPINYGGRQAYAFWQKAEAYEGALSGRLKEFYARREDFSAFAKCHCAADAIGRVTAGIDYFRTVYEEGGSAGAVQALIDYAAGRNCDLHTFLAATADSKFKLDAGAGADAVTITTIHSSKGLEYDFVIVADCARQFRMSDAYESVLVTDDGVAVKIPDSAEHTLLPSVPWLYEKAVAPDRLREEELRLFYVALTRAKRKLVVCGKKKTRESEKSGTGCELDFMRNILPRTPDVRERDDDGTEDVSLPIASALADAICARIAFDYVPPNRPIKTSVTAISAYDLDDGEERTVVLTEDEVYDGGRRKNRGAKKSGDGVDPRSRGTAYHRAMELIDFTSPNIEDVRSKCENFELVDEAQILRAAETMNRLAAGCAFVAKERYFIVDMPTSRIFGEGDGSVLVQGVIDLLLIDGDGCATVIDYKTTAPDMLDCAAYRTQLELYSAAVEKCTPYKVKRAALYSFITGEFVELGDMKAGKQRI